MKLSIRRAIGLTAFLILASGAPLYPASTEGKDQMLPLGSPVPEFRLPDVVTGKQFSPGDFSGKKALVVIFLCRHCPYVQHVKSGLSQLARDYAGRDVAFVAISSNDPAAYPQDAPESLKALAEEEGFPFPLLFDESQQTGKDFTAVATPDFFIFDAGRRLAYRGQFDESRPGSPVPVTGGDVRRALDALLLGQPVPSGQKPAVGCSIKWKQGNQPAY
jgi:peroxiredoxin